MATTGSAQARLTTEEWSPRGEAALRPAPEARGRIPSLDGIRALSIAMVLYAHLVGTRGFLRDGLGFDLGDLGVRVFFVISGYLISTLLFAESARTGTISLRGFYGRRAFRILPASYAYALVIIALSGRGVVALAPGDAGHALTFSMNYHHPRAWWLGHLWSLSVEEQFYLLWPSVLLWAGTRRGLMIAAAAVVLAPVARGVSLAVAPLDYARSSESFPTVCDALATGCLLAGAREWLGSSPRYLRLLRSPLGMAMPLLAVGTNLLARHPRFHFLVGNATINVAVALGIDRAVRFPTGLAGRLLNARPVAFVGQLSYSLYLWQQPFLNRTAQGPLCRFPLNLGLAALAALASFYLIEQPFLRLRARRRGTA